MMAACPCSVRIAVMVAVLACASKTSASPSARPFNDYMNIARKAAIQKQYDLAAAAWQAAYGIKPQPRLLFNIAWAQDQANHTSEALAGYEHFVAEDPSSPKRDEAEGRIATLSTHMPITIQVPRVAQRLPYIEAGAGLIISGRQFAFDENGGASCYSYNKPNAMGQSVFNPFSRCPHFSSTATTGLRLDATVYPLATGSIRMLRGLGLGGTVDILFHPDSLFTNDGTPVSLPTSEVRAELGLRWIWHLPALDGRLAMLADIQYGLHQFVIQPESKLVNDPQDESKTLLQTDNHGLPAIRYQYLDLGAGLRVPYLIRSSLYVGSLVDFHYHATLSYGDIEAGTTGPGQRDGGYGPVGNGYGLRIGWTPIEVMPWRGIVLRLQAYYERFALSFKMGDGSTGHELPPQSRTADSTAEYLARGATDQYYGGVLQVSYLY